VRAKKWIQVHNVAPVVVVALKRFEFTAAASALQKVCFYGSGGYSDGCGSTCTEVSRNYASRYFAPSFFAIFPLSL